MQCLHSRLSGFHGKQTLLCRHNTGGEAEGFTQLRRERRRLPLSCEHRAGGTPWRALVVTNVLTRAWAASTVLKTTHTGARLTATAVMRINVRVDVYMGASAAVQSERDTPGCPGIRVVSACTRPRAARRPANSRRQPPKGGLGAMRPEASPWGCTGWGD